MGKPAARLGDMTAHGGTITGPGCPTVLIGGMPAATMGDMHVCPMVTPGTPPIPHVGGPITLGSTGVLIGGKPAARMGDMAVCVGPPSSIILGCMTVLIGEAGGGGGGGGAGAGGGGGGGAGTAGALQSAAIAGQTPQTEETDGHYLDMSFVDSANLPVGGVRYVMSCPDNTKIAGVLGDGIKRTGVPEGDYTITLRAITNAKWSTLKAKVGNSVTLTIDTLGIDNGAKATIEIFVRDGNYTDHYLETIAAQVTSDKVTASWTLKVDEKFLALSDAKTSKTRRFSLSFFFYKVVINGMSEQSGLLYFVDCAEINLQDANGKAIGQRSIEALLSTGEVKKTNLDTNGNIKLDNIPPGSFTVKFNLRNKK
jgi:uncharacterized Zn-binding protein involved in type VI secretion